MVYEQGTCVACGEEKQVEHVRGIGKLCDPCNAKTSPTRQPKKVKRITKKQMKKLVTQEIFIVGDVKDILEKTEVTQRNVEMFNRRVMEKQDRIAHLKNVIASCEQSIERSKKWLGKLEPKLVFRKALDRPCLKDKKVQALGITEDGVIRAKIGGKWYASSPSENADGKAILVEVASVKERRATTSLIEKAQI